jgi:hypothetical protein
VVQLVVNKLLHHPTTALRASSTEEAEQRAAVLCELFGLEPAQDDGDPVAEPPQSEQALAEQKKAQA